MLDAGCLILDAGRNKEDIPVFTGIRSAFFLPDGIDQALGKITVYQEVEDHTHLPKVTAGHERGQGKYLSACEQDQP